MARLRRSPLIMGVCVTVMASVFSIAAAQHAQLAAPEACSNQPTFAPCGMHHQDHFLGRVLPQFGVDDDTNTSSPTLVPYPVPSSIPTAQPTPRPSAKPSPVPTPMPSAEPTPQPSPNPSRLPTPVPSYFPTKQPTNFPTPDPTPFPSPRPTPFPSPEPSAEPTPLPIPTPTPEPTPQPSAEPTPLPVPAPTPLPIPAPTPEPTPLPIPAPTPEPTPLPIPEPTMTPIPAPTATPTLLPTISLLPSQAPSSKPSATPTPAPTVSPLPTSTPTLAPSHVPVPVPTPYPTSTPTSVPSPRPTQSHCSNGIQDRDETDVDCGGDGCAACDLNQGCSDHSDCFPHICVSGICTETPDPTPLPTPAPTFSPPKVEEIVPLGRNFTEVDPTQKLTLDSETVSSDPLTTLRWSSTSFDSEFPLDLEFGVNTATALSNKILVIKAGILVSGVDYTFSMTATNRYGKQSVLDFNVTAGFPPRNGTFLASPTNGTALETDYTFFTFGWTDDATSFPLSTQFVYFLASGEEATLSDRIELDGDEGEPHTLVAENFSLPLGLGSHHELGVGVRTYDVIGASSLINTTVTVRPPSLNRAIDLVDEAISDLDNLIDESSQAASQLINTAASVVNFVLTQSNNTADALDRRSSLINFTASLITRYLDGASQSELQSQAVILAGLTGTQPETLSDDDLDQSFELMQRVVNVTASRPSASSTTAISSSLNAISNIVEAGYLTPDQVAEARMRRERRNRNRVRRGLLEDADGDDGDETRGDIADRLIVDLGVATAQDRVPAEVGNPVVSKFVALSALVLSAEALEVGLSAEGALTAEGDSTTVASVALPDMMDSIFEDTETATLVVTNWDTTNIFAAQTTESLMNGTVFTSISVASHDVSGLSDAITIFIPLPASYVDNSVTGERYQLNCSENYTGVLIEHTEEDYDRAEFCGYDLDEEGFTVTSLANRTVHCAADGSNHTMQCTNTTGVINYECPTLTSDAVCEFWNTTMTNWSSANCSLWYTDLDNNVAACNCTHLTTFIAQQVDHLSERYETFDETVRTADSLSLSTVRKNLGILLCLVGIWGGCLLLWLYDKHSRKVETTRILFETFDNQYIRGKVEFAHYSITKRRSMQRYTRPLLMKNMSAMLTKMQAQDEANGVEHRFSFFRPSTGSRQFDDDDADNESGGGGGGAPSVPLSDDTDGDDDASDDSRASSSGGESSRSATEEPPLRKSGPFSSFRPNYRTSNPDARLAAESAVREQQQQRPNQHNESMYSMASTVNSNMDLESQPSDFDFSAGGDIEMREAAGGGGVGRSGRFHGTGESFVDAGLNQERCDSAAGAAVPASPVSGGGDTDDEDDEESEQVLHNLEAEVRQNVEKQKRPIRNWWKELKEHHEVLALCFSRESSKDSKSSSKRGFVFLAKVLALLFIGCLSAPQEWLCPGNDGAMFPFPSQSENDSVLTFMVKFLFYSFLDIFYQCLLTIPLVLLLLYEFNLTDLIERSDNLHMERLYTHFDYAILRPDNIHTVEHALASLTLLRMLKHLMDRQASHLDDWTMRSTIRDALRVNDVRNDWFASLIGQGKTHSLSYQARERRSTTLGGGQGNAMRRRSTALFHTFGLGTESHANLTKGSRTASDAGTNDGRGGHRDSLDAEQIAQKLNLDDRPMRSDMSLWELKKEVYRRRALIKIAIVMMKMRLRELNGGDPDEDEDRLATGLLLTMPRTVRLYVREHKAIKIQMSGRICGCYIPLLSPCVKRLKEYVYSVYHVTNVGILKQRISRKRAIQRKRWISTFTILLLLFFSLYIFLYFVSLNDNEISIGVMLILLAAELVELMIAEPLLLLILVGLLPAIGAMMIAQDIDSAFGNTDRRRSFSRRLSHDLERISVEGAGGAGGGDGNDYSWSRAPSMGITAADVDREQNSPDVPL